MPRKLAHVPRPQTQHTAKVYFANETEELLVRSRVIMLNKNMSGYIRDLIMEDLTRAKMEAGLRNTIATNSPISPQQLPPGFTPGDDITFYTPEQLEEQLKEAEAKERELEELLKDI